ncbi:DUF6868 family protein [Methylophaga sp.]|uniref:DUF6868 family protein n=1 Tax=Methylophaga sp. TaxID=2024840 RepID=UPI00271BD7BB|nr:hypothetical protein [Methylophaga sp.]MDO8825075.1 hypothetical protein [Methylophaga sp.]
MTLENITFVLGWAAVLNFSLLIVWFIVYASSADKIYQLHSRWFNISREQFSQLHYCGMMFYKLAIFLFLLTPYIGLKFVPS